VWTAPETSDVVETEVEGQVEVVSVLAITGRNEIFALGFALLSLVLGILLATVAAAERRREA
jgi:hypothetical protein